ncbi:YpdA family putative bacillithiol disulfide reductase [Hazenella sp. IB182357]|uniref:YpdA family putative bacillithiol disulfide reductase n=1 Tax=Polycladospora coralii TaxID=2771432 RepID=A0A926N8K3_9BACL|nr:YpdA family putative bacillithiol disulfide reductase [Polycladospora coralii]
MIWKINTLEGRDKNLKEVIVIGAGPCGIAAAVALKKRGLTPLILDKGCIVNSIYHYPMSMRFFSTADNLEIGDIPFVSSHAKPTRDEALNYYRMVTKHYDLNIHTFEKVERMTPNEDGFEIVSQHQTGKKRYQASNVVWATGFYDQPNLLRIPGESFPHVHHYFQHAHPYSHQKVVVIGGRNSAVDAALELEFVGADVTLIYRGEHIHDSVKPWVRPLIESLIEKEKVKVLWKSEVKKIEPNYIWIEKEGCIQRLEADTVFAMTGYVPNLSLFTQLGGEIDLETGCPILSEEMETSIPGLYMAGVVVTGHDSTKVFIENGRYHGEIIATAIKAKKRTV